MEKSFFAVTNMNPTVKYYSLIEFHSFDENRPGILRAQGTARYKNRVWLMFSILLFRQRT